MESIIHCHPTHLTALAASLDRAFFHDPFYAYAFPDAATREALITLEMAHLICYGMRFGEVLTTENLGGCAVWLPPGETEFSEERMAEVGMLGTTAEFGLEGEKRLDEFVTATELFHNQVVRSPHWYLVLLGVDPDKQLQGIGSVLLAANLQRADEGKFPVYLETTKTANLPYYARHGFAIRAESPLPDGGVNVWYLVRDPMPQDATSSLE